MELNFKGTVYGCAQIVVTRGYENLMIIFILPQMVTAKVYSTFTQRVSVGTCTSIVRYDLTKSVTHNNYIL